MIIPGATREQIMQSLEVLESAYGGHLIDSKLQAATRSAEGFLHRRFYPERRTILRDWPNRSSSPSWELDLGDQELISVEAVVSGGTNITSDVVLRRGDDLAEPPYSSLHINLSTNSAFSAGTSWQRSLSIQGLFGYSDTSTALAGGALSGAINSSVTTLVINPLSGYYTVGIGSLLLIGTERLLIMDRRMSSTALTTTSAMTDINSARTFTSAGAASLAIGETILIDSERMRIDDIAGSTVIVSRAWDGTVLGSHTSGSTIYALRTFVAARGVLGSTAASHSDAASVYVHDFPPLFNELVVAETVVLLEQSSGAYSRTSSSGTRGVSAAGWVTRNTGVGKGAPGLGLDDIRERAWMELGRKSRSAAI